MFGIPFGLWGSNIISSGASLILWLDGDDVATITKDGGNNVSQWNDKSGNGNHVSQGTAASQPLYVASGINSKGSIDFNDDFLSRGDALGLTGSPAITVICVLDAIDNTGNLDNRVFHLGATGGTAGQTIGFGIKSTPSFRYNNGNQVFDGSSFGAPKIITWTRPSGGNYESGSAYIDDTARSQISSGSPTTVPNIANSVTKVGTGDFVGASNDGYIDGMIAELRVFDGELTSAELTTEHASLATKWGITI